MQNIIKGKMKKRIIIKIGKKEISFIAEECNMLEKTIGLMFSRREKAEILLFSFKQKQKIAIHSFFVFYPFLAVWLDERNRISKVKIIKPFIPYASSDRKCFRLAEIPISRKNRRIIKALVGN
jgi:uncharacterized membrane protein (UPF0127 family)